MMRKKGLLLSLLVLTACEEVDLPVRENEKTRIPVENVARLLSVLPVGAEQVREVRDAVASSVENGYDEEYMLRDLFRTPGAGVGDAGTRSGGSYDVPLRDLIAEHVRGGAGTRAAGLTGDLSADVYLSALESSDIQIYWPYSERAGQDDELPVITYDPDDGSDANTGWRPVIGEDGSRSVEEIIVDEDYARNHPVWVVNRNDDSAYRTLELMRREDPSWGSGEGGELLVGPLRSGWNKAGTRTADGKLRSLVLKTFTMKRHFDPWFAGASEFFVKIGAIDEFYASTEAELLLYQPTITDFMIVVRRMQLGQPRPFNAILVSDWTEQLESCAFMIIEDDGGTQTSWKTEGEVKIKSKTYGFSVNLPFRTRDDIVWRGNLSGRYFERYNNVTGHFGDVDLTFEILER